MTAITHGDDAIDMIDENQFEETLGHVRKALYHVEQKMKQENTNNIETQLDKTMMKILLMNMEVAEVYSPPRVTQMARKMGLRAGWSLDLTTHDSDGRAWDFNNKEMRNRAARRLLQDQPLLLVGSPMCTVYSSMNQINHGRMTAEEVEARFRYARRHLEFCVKLYNMQLEAGRYFLHEHPYGASSWNEPCIQKMMEKNNVVKVMGDQCMYGLKSKGKDGEGPARKSTGFMTNSVCIAQELNRRCPNRAGFMVHRHVILEGGRTKQAQVYPQELCKAICIGLQKQIKADAAGQFLLTEMDNENTSSQDLMNVAKEMMKKYKTIEEPECEDLEVAWDDVSGAELDPKQVRKAREEEVEYVHKMKLYDKVPTSECYQRTGKAPISVRWIDINKGDQQHPNYRSRLVAREINTHKRDDLFAATPPLEALKLIIAMTATANKGEVIMVNDISRAFFHAKVTLSSRALIILAISLLS